MTIFSVEFTTLFACHIIRVFWGFPVLSLLGATDGIGWMFALAIFEVTSPFFFIAVYI